MATYFVERMPRGYPEKERAAFAARELRPAGRRNYFVVPGAVGCCVGEPVVPVAPPVLPTVPDVLPPTPVLPVPELAAPEELPEPDMPDPALPPTLEPMSLRHLVFASPESLSQLARACASVVALPEAPAEPDAPAPVVPLAPALLLVPLSVDDAPLLALSPPAIATLEAARNAAAMAALRIFVFIELLLMGLGNGTASRSSKRCA
jgi:hypothetical protein